VLILLSNYVPFIVLEKVNKLEFFIHFLKTKRTTDATEHIFLGYAEASEVFVRENKIVKMKTVQLTLSARRPLNFKIPRAGVF
jgi:hypothetical protein